MGTTPERPLTVAELRAALEPAHDEAFVMIELDPSEIMRAQRAAEAGLTLGFAFDVDVAGSPRVP